jgi:hypothetical protein
MASNPRVYRVTHAYANWDQLVTTENAAIVERLSKVLGVSPDELVRKGIEEFLQAQLRVCFAEMHDIKTRYEVKSAAELEKKIRRGAITEHPAWEDLIVLENLEERAKKIRKEQRKN